MRIRRRKDTKEMVSTVTKDFTRLMESIQRRGESRRGNESSGAAIQLLRANALMLVFFFHFSGFADPGQGMVAMCAGWFQQFGSLGTDSFLVVSGALGWISCQRRGETWWEFVGRRMRRLYPPFLVMIGLYTILSWAFPQQSKFPAGWLEAGGYLLRNLILVPGVFPERPLMTVSWALALIFTFYAVIPGLRRGVEWMSRGPERAVVVLSGMLVGWLWLCEQVPGLPWRAVFLLMGCVVAATFSSREWEGWKSTAWLALGVACLSGYVGLAYTETVHGGIRVVFELVGLAAVTRACLMSRVEENPVKAALRWPMVALGNMGYSFFLTHGLAIKFVFVVLGPRISAGRMGWQWALPTLALALVAATALFRFVEQPGRWPWEAPIPVAGGDPLGARPVLQAMAARA